jgi:hypothetical protein
MRRGESQIESKRFSGVRTTVTFDEIKRWVELWPDVRAKVVSNQEAYQMLSGLGLRYRDPRTIRTYIDKILPLVNTNAISAVIDLVDFCENRMPIKEFMLLVREKFPLEELGPKLTNVADTIIKEAPPPTKILKAVSAILSGGFPFDDRLKKK